MVLKEFIFIIESPDGSEYEIAVPARRVVDAERLLGNYFAATSSQDKIISLKESRIEH